MPARPPDLREVLSLVEANRLAAAETMIRKIVTAAPASPEAAFLAGFVAQRRERPDDAAACYRRALALAPGYVDAHNNLGNVLLSQGRAEEAIACFRRATALEPGLAVAHFNLGNALAARDALGALQSYRRVLALQPDNVETLNNIAALLRRLGQPSAAAGHLRRALALRPDHAPAHANLAAALIELGETEDAMAHSRRAVELDPGNATVHSDLIFNLNFDVRADTAAQQAERRRWAARHADALSPQAPPRPRDPDPERRLKVGYVSAHFRAYAATFAFGGVLLNHDPKAVEVFCYSDTRDADDLTGLFRARADHWRETSGMSDEAVAVLVRRDGIDILVDLVGHMGGNRLLVFARKPAPVQITAWGEPTGTGLRTMDYLFADPVLVPPAERPLLAERVIDLPAALGFWTPETLPAPGPLPALTNGHVTFGSFNRRAKVTDTTLACWARVMRDLPDARLVLKNKAYGDAVESGALRAALESTGIDPGRVTVLGQTARAEHFAAYRDIDIALDPFPHGGGMTTLDALAMGVPVVTRPGNTISSRLAASCLAALGLTNWIADGAETYAALAVAMARDLDALAALRRDLPGRLAASAQGDPMRYARAVELAYREAWRRCCAKAQASH